MSPILPTLALKSRDTNIGASARRSPAGVVLCSTDACGRFPAREVVTVMSSPISPPPVRRWRPEFLPAYVGNGVMGLRVTRVPLRDGVAIVSGFAGIHPTDWVEAFARAPYPLAGDVVLGDAALSEFTEGVTLVEQRYDFSCGELTTRLRFDAGAVGRARGPHVLQPHATDDRCPRGVLFGSNARPTLPLSPPSTRSGCPATGMRAIASRRKASMARCAGRATERCPRAGPPTRRSCSARRTCAGERRAGSSSGSPRPTPFVPGPGALPAAAADESRPRRPPRGARPPGDPPRPSGGWTGFDELRAAEPRAPGSTLWEARVRLVGARGAGRRWRTPRSSTCTPRRTRRRRPARRCSGSPTGPTTTTTAAT